ncbi:hypothetical protein [Acinetobacter bereziniae]|uniref:hypothetical protein n=1 Tax=Acinetobacter bereziniae TaxID=106648 RepID=UPI001902949F|nr:hypothetical protein [Acinetobacter bereziniae]MBJ8554541.1 hypothetical protein [Acinetobacter bereziniae]
MINPIQLTSIMLFIFLSVSCTSTDTKKIQMIEKSKQDFIFGCTNSGEFDEIVCNCVFNDLNKNYKQNFTLDESKLIENSEENKTYKVKIIDAFRNCDAL